MSSEEFDELLTGLSHRASRVPIAAQIMSFPEYHARQLLLANFYRIEQVEEKDLGGRFPEICQEAYAIISSFSLESMQTLLKNDSGRRLLAQTIVPGKVINRALLTMLLMLVGESASTRMEVSTDTAPISIMVAV